MRPTVADRQQRGLSVYIDLSVGLWASHSSKPCKYRLNRSRCRLGCGLGLPKESMCWAG